MSSLAKEASMFGGIGRSMQNKISRDSKHRNDRIVHKRQRRSAKKEIVEQTHVVVLVAGNKKQIIRRVAQSG